MTKEISFEFLKSALHSTDTNGAVEWIKVQNEAVNVKVKRIKFDQLNLWNFDSVKGNLKHDTGKFFSIDGIRVNTTWGNTSSWDQPIINQPEIGYLGFIVKKMEGVLHFLVQAKIEPGNVNYVQLSPTLQATRSNYQQEHKGKKPLYLEYFQNATKDQILLDQLQSEQGARFLRKRNRNIIIHIEEDIKVEDNFTWLTLGQLKKLMQLDNIVNMDTRTVISGIPFGNFSEQAVNFISYLTDTNSVSEKFLKSALTQDDSKHSIEEVITFLAELKSTYDLSVEKIPLKEVKHWYVTDTEIKHELDKFFKIIAVEVEIGNREVVKWSQPMVQPAQEGLCAFVCKEINGIYHFAVQAKLECGNHDVFELAPTVQTLTGDKDKTPIGNLPFLDYVKNIKKEQVYFDALQSEEGGRFYREQNRNIIIIAGDEVSEDLPDNFIWMTLNQLYVFLKFNNYLNIQSRSLIAAIGFK